MAGDDDVGEGKEPREDVILDYLSGEVVEKEIALFFVDIDG